MILFLSIGVVFGQRIAFETSTEHPILDVVLSPDSSLVAFGGEAQVMLYDLNEWSLTNLAPCASGEGRGLAFTDDGDLVMGCSDGSLSIYQTSSGLLSQNKATFESDAILSLNIKDDTLYAVAENPTGGQPRVHSMTLNDYQETTGNYPSTLSMSGMKDSEVIGNYLVISHGGSSVSKVDLSSGSPSRDEDGPTNVEHQDVLNDPNGSNAIIAGGSGGIIRFLFSSNDTQYALGSAYVTDATAVAEYNGELWIADGMKLHSYSYASNGASVGDSMLNEVIWNSNESISEMVFVDDYLIYGASGGSYGVITDRPWVEIDSISASSAVDGDPITLTFTSDTAGAYSVRVGALENGAGQLVASGDAIEGVPVSIEMVVDDHFSEGDNPIRVEIASDKIGHDSIALTVDNPPGTVSVTDDNLGSGNGKLSLQFEPLEDPDILEYQVYVSTEVFEPSDFLTGGPSFDAIALAERTIPHDGNQTASLTISPLSNDIRYYIGVRAIDKGGMEGPISTIISGVPKMTRSASSLSNETGGYCGVSAPIGFGLALVGACFAALRRRPSLLVAFLAAYPMQASAKDSFKTNPEPTVRNGIEVQYGPLFFDSEALNLVFGESGNRALFVNAGQTYWNVLEMSFGAGFIQEMGFLLTDENSVSTDHDMLTILPLSVNANLRLDFLNDQPIVPTASIGLDYWVWRENWVESGVETDQSGGKLGWNYALGIEVLLDYFDQNGSANMDVFYGVKDTYFVIEHRRQQIGQWADTPGLLFHGSATTFGFRFQR